jgi:hexosaminidase
MRKLTHMLLAGTLILACSSCGVETTANYQVIPLPQEVALSQESPFNLNDGTIIAYPEHNELLKRNAEFLAEYISQSTGHTLQTEALAPGSEAPKGAITLGLDPAIGNREGYVLTVKADRVTLNGQTENGVFYGIQTLRKSIPAETKATSILLPAGSIQDEPRFSYRGMHLDVGRHFFPIEFVKKYIDLLALHNMNTFHWHLTEDQGWRIEIKKYPKLTEIGAWRDRTVIGRNTEEYDNTRYGGFYTQEQAKEIVKYAGERYITVIPEVDLPGHMLAALAAYPEMGCTGGPYEVCPRWGVFEDVLCIGNEKSMQFLEDVMAEIIDIFPSKYIHIGGDEAPRTRWEKCPKCQARIRTEKLKADKNHTAEDRLQSYCMTRIEKLLNSKGRQIIGWDEILEGDVAPNATVMSWRGSAGGIKAAQLGHDVIMTPNDYCYFDYYQSEDTRHEPFAIGGFVPLEKVYSLNPTASLTEEQAKHILGTQANLWTEYIPTSEQVEYMVLPRMAALAEVQWTQLEKKDYTNFTTFRPQLFPQLVEGYWEVFALMALGYLLHFVPDSWERACTKTVIRLPLLGKAVLMLAVIYLVIQMKSSEIQPFIYFQF